MVVRQFPGWSSSVRAGTGRRQRGTSDAQKRLRLRGAVVALGVCLACLGGCRIDAKVEFKADGASTPRSYSKTPQTQCEPSKATAKS